VLSIDDRSEYLVRMISAAIALASTVLLGSAPAVPDGAKASDADLRFWLEDAIAWHRFSLDEAAAAVGLPAAEVERRAREWGIERGKVPPRRDGDPLALLPYPGGRHPRIGFLDGAVDPLRETKASVFLPWEGGGYVVIDVPEAVFSDRGLLYLAHTHIPTVWDEKKLKLPPLEWRRVPDGLVSHRVLPDGTAFGARVAPRRDGVDLELWLRNGTDAPLTKLRTQVCLLLKGAPGFDAQVSENKSTVPLPWGEAMAVRSADGRRWIAVAWERSKAWENKLCPCFHSDPTLPDCPPGATVRVRGRFLCGEGTDPVAEIRRLNGAGDLLPRRAAAAERALEGAKVGAAQVEIAADDSMVIGGGIGPGGAKGQEARLRAAAVVVGSGSTAIAIVACDVLMTARDVVDGAVRRIEAETGIPASNVLVSATHTHHAPTTVTIHGYARDEVFCRRMGDAVVEAVKAAKARMAAAEPGPLHFRKGEEATVGQNSRLLLADGTVFWVGPRDDAVRPTGPFDPELPVLAFRRPSGALEALLFSHSTHCIGAREGGKRSPGFYGLAAQDLEAELGGMAVFLAGAFGSTHNLTLPGRECALRIREAVRKALAAAAPRDAAVLRSLKREFRYRVRDFDEAKEDAAVVAYCKKRVGGSEYTIDVFRKMRAALAPHRGEERTTWVQAMRIGDVAIAGAPGELFTGLGVELKRRSPFPRTIVAGVANDAIGYIPDAEAFDLGGYQVWTGFHSLVARGTGEALVAACAGLLDELSLE
jgi:neutral ceramidase